MVRIDIWDVQKPEDAMPINCGFPRHLEDRYGTSTSDESMQDGTTPTFEYDGRQLASETTFSSRSFTQAIII
jgi:hypothetical protein